MWAWPRAPSQSSDRGEAHAAPRRDRGDHAEGRLRRRQLPQRGRRSRHAARRSSTTTSRPSTTCSSRVLQRRAERNVERMAECAAVRRAAAGVVGAGLGPSGHRALRRAPGGREPPPGAQGRGRRSGPRGPRDADRARSTRSSTSTGSTATSSRRSSSPPRCRASRSGWCRTRSPATTPLPTRPPRPWGGSSPASRNDEPPLVALTSGDLASYNDRSDFVGQPGRHVMSTTETGAARYTGARVHRVEDPRLLQGRGTFVDDVVRPGMLHACFVRSPFARARIGSIDASAALALPGVRAVFTAADLNPGVHEQWYTSMGKDVPDTPRPPLAEGEVRHVGDPVALVVAERPLRRRGRRRPRRRRLRPAATGGRLRRRARRRAARARRLPGQRRRARSASRRPSGSLASSSPRRTTSA